MSDSVEQRVLDLRLELPYEVSAVFHCFTTPRLLEEWSSPQGLDLSVPVFGPREGGEYRYEHSDVHGKTWVCTGYFKEFERDERLVMVDNVKGPDGKTLHRELECIVDFEDLGGHTSLHVRQRGFKDIAALKECKRGWKECLDKLEALLAREAGHRPRSSGARGAFLPGSTQVGPQ